ncbi:MAG: GNAT superfamily N-acetyltransferase [Candidatus Krumholzibacteriia bacterium]|jgi:GNAT superfamily N-acetyltransferase
MEWTRNGYRVSDDRSELDMFYIVPALKQSYWATDRPEAIVAASIENSLSLGLYVEGRQIGFARAVTDKCTFAWICDVMVHPDHRGVGLGKWLIECLSAHPDVADVTQEMLRTRDAHGLYEQYGYSVCDAMVKKKDPPEQTS